MSNVTKRRLVAAIACRNNGTRLYGKPLQNLIGSTSILEQIINAVRKMQEIDDIVLGIAEGSDNHSFIDFAHKHNLNYILGSPKDVLMRLIQCGRISNATDIFRVTSECPWFAYNMLDEMWKAHINCKNDITVCDGLPEGLHFEIYSLDSLEKSHALGDEEDRSEFCSNYARKNPSNFKIQVLLPDKKLRRMDLRVTVDYPEDLILCRAIAKHYKDNLPIISVEQIIDFLDQNIQLKNLVSPYVVNKGIWI